MKIENINIFQKWQSIGLLFFLSFFNFSGYSVEIISIDEAYTTRNITAECGYLQLKDCDTVFFSRAFHPIDRDHFSVSSLASCILIEVRLFNDCSEKQEMTLELVNPYLYDVKYSIGAADIGINQNFLKNLKNKNNLHPSIDFTIEKGESEVVYLLIPVQYHSTFFSVYLSKKRNFIQADFTNTYFISAIIGGLIAYLIIILILALVSRNKLLTRYAFIDFWVLLFIAVDSGLMSKFWFGGAPLAQNLLLLTIGLGYLGSMIYFIRAFFDLQQNHHRIANFLKVLFFSLILLAVFAFYTEQESSFIVLKRKVLVHVVNSVLLITLFSFYYLGISNYLKSKRREVLWFLGAFLLHIVSWFFILCYKGYFSANLSALDDLPFHFLGLYGNIPLITYILLFVEMLTVSYFIVLGFKNVLDDYSISLEKMKIQEDAYLAGMINGQELERIKIERALEDKILLKINNIEEELRSLTHLETNNQSVKGLMTELQNIHSIKQTLSNVANDFVQRELLEMDFNDAVERIFEHAFSDQEQIVVRLNCKIKGEDLGEGLRHNILRITQEVLNNIIKHAKATKVDAVFIHENSQFRMNINDNGQGVDLDVKEHSGMGIKTIITRVRSLGGSVAFDKNETGGLSVSIQIPTNIQ